MKTMCYLYCRSKFDDNTPFDDRLVPVIGPAWRMVVHRAKTSMKSGFGNPRFVSATRTLFGQQIKFCLIGKNSLANQAGFVQSSSWSVLESSRTDLTLGVLEYAISSMYYHSM